MNDDEDDYDDDDYDEDFDFKAIGQRGGGKQWAGSRGNKR